MANSTYELLLKNLEDKLNKENAEATQQEINYATTRTASQQQATQLKKGSGIKPLINVNQNQLTLNQKYEVIPEESQVVQHNWWEDFWVKTNEILLTAGYAVMKPLEGIADFGANAIGWIGEKTGNQDLANNMKSFATRDLTKEFQTNGIAQIFMPSYGIGFTQDLVNSAIKGKWDIGMDSSIWRRSTDNVNEAPDWAVNTAEGVGQAVGYALLSFATGGIGSAVGGAGAGMTASIGSKIASGVSQYAPIFVSATGSATTQALNEGASYDDAVRYGVLSGATEAIAEAFVGGAVNKIAGGAGATIGGFGALKKAKTAGGSILRNLIASANEEGIEEVFSSVLDPIWKSVTYKYNSDQNFFERYANEFNENGGFMGLVTDYLVGAGSALILGGAETAGAVVRASDNLSVKGLKKGLQTVQLSTDIGKILEIKQDIASEQLRINLKGEEVKSEKLNNLENELTKVQDKIQNKFSNLLNNLDNLVDAEKNNTIKKGEKVQLETIKAYNEANDINTETMAMNKMFESSRFQVQQQSDLEKLNVKLQKELDVLDARIENTTDVKLKEQLEKEADNKYLQLVKAKNALRAFENHKNTYGWVNPSTSTVYIRSKDANGERTLREKFKTALHERLHVATFGASVEHNENFSKQIKGYMIRELGEEKYNELLNEQKELQKDVFATSNEFKKAKEKDSSLTLEKALAKDNHTFDSWFEEEVSADFIFELFNTPEEAITVFDGIKGGKQLAQKLLNVVRGAFNNKKRPEGYNKLIKALKEASKETNKEIAKAEKEAQKSKKSEAKAEPVRAQKSGEITKEDVKTDTKYSKKLTVVNEIEDILTPEEDTELDKILEELLDIEDLEELDADTSKPLWKIAEEQEVTPEEAMGGYVDSEETIITLNELLNPKVKEFFKDSVVKSNRLDWFDGVKNGKYLIPMFHGTPNSDMYFFDSKKIGSNGTQRGAGFYLTNNLEYAQGYTGENGKVIVSFVNITKPMSDTKITVSKEQIKTFIKEFADPTGDDYLSAYGDAYSDYEGTLNKAVDNLFKYEQSDVDLFNEIYNVTKMDFDKYFGEITNRFGFDGVLFKNRAEGTIVIAFKSNQIKDINNTNPTKNPDIRFSKKRTNVDSEGNNLSQKQQEYFKDSKVRDENGNLLVVYHGTQKDFNVYDKAKLGKTTNSVDAKLGFHLTDNADLAKIFSTLYPDELIYRITDEVMEELGYDDVDEIERRLKEFVTKNGNVKKQYLNITKPLDITAGSKLISLHDLGFAINYALEGTKELNDSYDGINSFEDIAETLISNSNGELEQIKKELANTKGALNRLQELGYDGLILPITSVDSATLVNEYERGNKVKLGGREFIAFSSNQIKNVDNVSPTSNPDIRFSKKNTPTGNTTVISLASEKTTKIVDNANRNAFATLAEDIENPTIEKIDGEILDLIDELETDLTGAYEKVIRKLPMWKNRLKPMIKELQTFFDTAEIGKNDDLLYEKVNQVETLFSTLMSLKEFTNKNNLAKLKSDAKIKIFNNALMDFYSATKINISTELKNQINERLTFYASGASNINVDEHSQILKAHENEAVKKALEEVNQKYKQPHLSFKKDVNISKGNYSSMYQKAIRNKLDLISDLEASLQAYGKELVKAGVTLEVANKQIENLKSNEFKDVFVVRDKLLTVYAGEYKAKSTLENVKIAEKVKEEINETENKTVLGEVVADTITNELGQDLGNIKFVFPYDKKITDKIKENVKKRKENIKQSILDGLYLVKKGSKTTVKLTSLDEENTLRIHTQAYINELVDLMFEKNGSSDEIDSMLKTLRRQVKEKEIALDKGVKEVTEAKAKVEQLKKEKATLEKNIKDGLEVLKKFERENKRQTNEYKKVQKELSEFQHRNDELVKLLRKANLRASTILNDEIEIRENLLKEIRRSEKETARANQRIIRAYEQWASERSNYKGKWKTSDHFINNLQSIGSWLSDNSNFNIKDKRSIDILSEMMSNFNDEHEVIFTSENVNTKYRKVLDENGNWVEKEWIRTATSQNLTDNEQPLTVKMRKGEIALTYFWNMVAGNEFVSKYAYPQTYDEIIKNVQQNSGLDDQDIELINRAILGINMAEPTAYAKMLEKHAERVRMEYERYLAKKGELRLFKHSYQARERIMALKNRVESYEKKFGRLSGISDEYYKVVNEFKTELSNLSVNQIANGEYLNALENFYKGINKIKNELNSGTEEQKRLAQFLEFVPELENQIKWIINNTDVTDIDTTDIDIFSKTITGIKKFITEVKEHRLVTVNNKIVSLQAISQQGIEEQQKLNKHGKEKFRRVAGYLNPSVMFDVFDGFNRNGIFKQLYADLELGQNKYAENLMNLVAPFDEFKKEHKKFGKDIQQKYSGNIEVDGQKLDATIAQLLTIYESIERMQAFEHLATSGFDLGNNQKIVFGYENELDNKIKNEFAFYKLTDEQLEKVTKLLKENLRVKKIADLENLANSVNEIINAGEFGFDYEEIKDLLKSLRNTVSETIESKILKLKGDISEALNLDNKDSSYRQYLDIVNDFFLKAKDLKVEADMEILGFTNASDGFYFPIRVSDLDLQQNFGIGTSMEEMDAREYAFNQNITSTLGTLLIMNIDNIVDRHMRNISLYNAYSPRVETLKRVYNWKQSRGVTLAQNLKARYGEDAGKIDKYIDTLVRDIQGSKYGKTNTEMAFDKAINFFRGNAISVALGANPKVWFSQLASIPSAMKYIKLNNLTKALSNISGKKDLPSLPYLGQYRRYNSEVIRSETFIDKVDGTLTRIKNAPMKPIQWFDSGAINVIWYASLLQTQKADGSWNIDEATDLFTRTVNETQPNYNPLGRPEILRTNNALLRMFVMYKTQAFQNFSNAYQAISTLIYKVKRGIPLDETVRDANGKIISYGDKDKALRVLTALFLQGVLFTSIGYFFKRLINNDWGQDLGKHLGQDLGVQFLNDNLLGMTPIINKIQIDLDSKSFLKTNISGWTDNYTDLLEKMVNFEGLSPKDWTTLFANLTGIPATNMYKYTKTVLQYVLPNEMVQSIDIGYRGKTVTKQLISKATNDRLSLTYYNIYNKNISSLSNSVSKEMYRLYKNGFTSVILKEIPTNITYDGNEYSVIPAEFNYTYSRLSKQIETLIASSSYQKLTDEEKAWQIQKLIDIYYGASKASVTGENFTKLQTLAYSGFNFTSDILHTYQAVSQITGNEKQKKSLLVQKYINKQKISAGAKYLIWWLCGYGLTTVQKSLVTNYLAQNGASKKDISKIF